MNLLSMWVVPRLTWPLTGGRRADAAKPVEEFAASRWCDQIEREINDQIIHFHPRPGSRQG